MTKPFTTPVLLVIFNRPDLTLQVFNQIKTLKPRYLFVAADGPRPERPDDIINCARTREIIDSVDWPCEIRKLYREKNVGCGYGVCSAISWFFDQVEGGIILEDDCVPEISFFHFCSELLDKYKDDQDIYLITGTNVQNGITRGNASYYFSNYTITWGWASWRRAWNHFQYDIPDYKNSFSRGELDHVFRSREERKYWFKRIKQAQAEKKDIWDYQWYYSVWKNKGFGITPNINLIKNVGFRNNAVHNFLRDSIREPSAERAITFPLIHPDKQIDHEADRYTFINTYSHALRRLLRLSKENGIWQLMKYYFDGLKADIR